MRKRQARRGRREEKEKRGDESFESLSDQRFRKVELNSSTALTATRKQWNPAFLNYSSLGFVLAGVWGLLFGCRLFGFGVAAVCCLLSLLVLCRVCTD